MAPMSLFATTALLACFVLAAYSIPLRSARDVGDAGNSTTTSRTTKAPVIDPKTNKTIEYCHNNSPCGWEIYVPFSKEIVDYMKNTCVCNDDYHCIRWDDDISVSAFIFECRHSSEKSKEPSYFA